VRISWSEVVRSYKEPGFFARADRGLDASIDVESAEARARLEDLVPPRLEQGAIAYERVELSLFADGERRHDCALGPRPKERPADPREAHLVALAFPRGGRDAADADRFEFSVRWGEDGRPAIAAQQLRPGSLSAKRRGFIETTSLRARFDALRESPPVERIAWQSRASGSRIWFKARPLLAALAELAPTLAPRQVEEAQALLAAPDAALSEPSWLPLLARRKGTLAKLADGLSCKACDADHPGRALVERPFDTRTGGLWGEAGIVYECPKGHEVEKIVEAK
jgi:hypothetical protein